MYKSDYDFVEERHVIKKVVETTPDISGKLAIIFYSTYPTNDYGFEVYKNGSIYSSFDLPSDSHVDHIEGTMTQIPIKTGDEFKIIATYTRTLNMEVYRQTGYFTGDESMVGGEFNFKISKGTLPGETTTTVDWVIGLKTI